MQVTWDPRNGDPEQVWQFDSEEDVTSKRGMQIEQNYGGTYAEWTVGLQTGELKARTVLLWYMLSEVHPALKLDAVPEFRVAQLRVEMGVEELKKLWKRVTRMRLPADQREKFEMAFEMDMADALEREGYRRDGFEIINDQLQVEAGQDLPKPA